MTGDTPGTATEIARQIGLWKPETDNDRNRITGVAFAELSDEEALDRVMDLKIMSRARPTDKQRLVQLLQQKGAVVAVTGDGTNDAPALNHAQVGLSMGTGTSVAKEASDITLLDDSFNSIGTAVMWGRSLYKNIQRFIVFQLTINFVALLIVLLGSVIGTELPLTVTQMLWVNLIMDTFAALALASIPPSETVMLEKPRRSTDFIISKAMRSNILGVGSIFLIVLLGMIYYFDHSTEGMDIHNLTIFFTFFVMLQFWNLFNARVFGTTNSAFKGLSKSYGMELIVLAILAGQFLIVQFGGAVFRTEPLDWQTWLLIIGVSSTVLWVGELIRLVQRIIHKKNRNEKEKVKLLQSEVKKLKKEKQIDYKSNYDSEKYSKSIRNVLSYIEENYHQDISLESAATEVFMNKNYLSSLFCNEMGVGFTKYLSDFRLKKAKILLRETELNINEIANMTGFATANYFVRVFKKQENCTPKEYRIMEERKLK